MGICCVYYVAPPPAWLGCLFWLRCVSFWSGGWLVVCIGWVAVASRSLFYLFGRLVGQLRGLGGWRPVCGSSFFHFWWCWFSIVLVLIFDSPGFDFRWWWSWKACIWFSMVPLLVFWKVLVLIFDGPGFWWSWFLIFDFPGFDGPDFDFRWPWFWFSMVLVF